MIDRSVKFRRTRRAVPRCRCRVDRADTDALAQSDSSDLDAVRGSVDARKPQQAARLPHDLIILTGSAPARPARTCQGRQARLWAERPDTLAGAPPIVVFVIVLSSLVIVPPGQTSVVQFFGRYVGTLRTQGLSWVLLLTSRRRVGVRVRNFETHHLKVNDADGNPVEIAAIVVWQVVTRVDRHRRGRTRAGGGPAGGDRRARDRRGPDQPSRLRAGDRTGDAAQATGERGGRRPVPGLSKGPSAWCGWLSSSLMSKASSSLTRSARPPW
jgi:hypothetical protein